LQKIGREIDFIILSKLMDLSVRPLAAEDFDGFINYWLGLSQAEIEHLGVAIDGLPSAARMRSDLEAMLLAPHHGVGSFVLAWCINGEAIGHSSLKDIVPGNFGSMHLHMWRADLRGKGHGPHLFCLAAVDFYERFQLKHIICEPKADNAPPNRLLQRIGFPRISTRIGRSSELSRVCKLNSYDIVREIAEDYLLCADRKNEAGKIHPMTKIESPD
jgi:[ribosomal protein S5]-alanine N-acetyltransferase